MNGYSPQRHHDRAVLSRTHYREDVLPSTSVWDRLQQPSVLVPLILFVLGIFYNSLHKSPLDRHRHPGQVLWDVIVTVTPASLLYSLDNWLHPPMFPVSKSLAPTAQPQTYAAKSDALRRILGMDKPGGIIKTVASAGLKGIHTFSNGALLKAKTDRPAGLGNYDNSCFQNSILQGLSALKPLPSYLAAASDNTDAGSAGTLKELLAQLTDRHNNGATLWTPKKLKSLDTWQQQDAQEYFSKLLDEIDKEVTKAAKANHKPFGLESATAQDETAASQHSDDSGYQSLSGLSRTNSEPKAPRNPLEGLVAQRVACVQCGFSEGLSMIPFNCLTLNLGVANEYNLYERLDSYAHLEAIEGVHCAKCTLVKVQRLLKILVARGGDGGLPDAALAEPRARLAAVDLALEEDDFEDKTLADKCKIVAQHRVNTTKTKQVVVARPPQSLAIHMNRSVFDDRTGNMFKNFAAVRFPSTLDLGSWCLGSAGGSAVKVEGQGAGEEEHWMGGPRSSMVSGSQKQSKITGPLYELRAVVTHQGRHENGHYVCYRKHPYRPTKLADNDDLDSDIFEPAMDTPSLLSDEETLVEDLDDSEETASKWWRLSDESVWEVTEDEVLDQGGVFMLFYDCVDPNSVFTSEAEKEDAHAAHGGESADDNENLSAEQTTAPSTVVETVQSHTDKLSRRTTTESHAAKRHLTLMPQLAEGETVDAIIPLRRPNS
ncbi:ubiquitin carboxyl-terminal hydrolase 1 [Microdochium nivale]|nr:ubiquitin carboxyl-terminal hydrolase 1 [Microdochium nivale]